MQKGALELYFLRIKPLIYYLTVNWRSTYSHLMFYVLLLHEFTSFSDRCYLKLLPVNLINMSITQKEPHYFWPENDHNFHCTVKYSGLFKIWLMGLMCFPDIQAAMATVSLMFDTFAGACGGKSSKGLYQESRFIWCAPVLFNHAAVGSWYKTSINMWVVHFMTDLSPKITECSQLLGNYISMYNIYVAVKQFKETV